MGSIANVDLRDEHALTVGLGAPWRIRDARDLTDTKRQRTPPSKIVRT